MSGFADRRAADLLAVFERALPGAADRVVGSARRWLPAGAHVDRPCKALARPPDLMPWRTQWSPEAVQVAWGAGLMLDFVLRCATAFEVTDPGEVWHWLLPAGTVAPAPGEARYRLIHGRLDPSGHLYDAQQAEDEVCRWKALRRNVRAELDLAASLAVARRRAG